MNNAILPMPPFDWLQSSWEDYFQRIRDNKLPHAFLLAGQEGIGVDSLALAMGQYLLCNSPLNEIACGKCRGCQLLSAQTHPDLLLVEPEEAGKQIKVDQIREITSFVDQTAQQGGYKIIILAPAEAMNVNAANALLKNLEEPAGKTVFFLVSYQINRVLPTIRSRCAKLNLFPPAKSQAIEWLQSVGVEDAERLLQEAKGAPLLAKQWHEDGVIEQRFDLIKDLAKIADYSLEPMSFAKKWAKFEPLVIVEPMILCLEAILAHKVAQQAYPEQYESLCRALVKCSPKLLFRLQERLCAKKAQLQSSANLNAALVIEELALDWAAILKAA